MNETPPSPRKHKVCPHCKKQILPLPLKPRDLGLLLNVLLYRVPVEVELTETWIEVARKHCRMKLERLAALRAEPHARHWPRLLERRAARLAYFKHHGELPAIWMPLLPGEPNRAAQISAFRRYRKGGLAKLKARLRKRPESTEAKLENRYAATKHIRSRKGKGAALDDVTARLVANLGAKAGKLKLAEYEDLKSIMLADDALPRRFRRQVKGTGLPVEPPEKKRGRKLRQKVPHSDSWAWRRILAMGAGGRSQQFRRLPITRLRKRIRCGAAKARPPATMSAPRRASTLDP